MKILIKSGWYIEMKENETQKEAEERLLAFVDKMQNDYISAYDNKEV